MSSFNSSVWNSPGSDSGLALFPVTGSRLVYGALRLLGVLRSGTGASPEAVADGFYSLNEMLDSWAAERLNVPGLARATFSLSPGLQTYAAGPGGDFDMPWPKLERAGVMVSNVELPVRIYKQLDWADVSVKDIQSSYPLAVFTDGGYPQLNLTYWPIPTQAYQVTLYAWAPIAGFADLETEYSLPRGYAQAIRYSLAVKLAPEFELHTKLSRINLPALAAQAVRYVGVVKRANAPEATPHARMDPALVKRRGNTVVLFGNPYTR